ncbi:winged helix-turn-helix transcriptional regulator [Methanosarcina barkeri]|uniref:Transcriptional regulator, ArsR family n=2 Tax=Methanosarcina barkeri TaxID=2208 RepID=A0A0E3QWW3_METBA|nr:winged helix-turn-helix transcriptional regulator [Methanosarcina barkeri]AKB56222.1 Transcriptional regulator, ArsR family [Methanosarcina barkeri MS]AKB59700.1 Transcriptional regulator, ArsR family [Methanosarcina barkeri 227]
MLKKSLLFILVLSTLGITSADTGGYTVGPCLPDEELEKLGDAVDMSGADVTYSFWEFPLSIKIAYIIGYLTVFFSFFKLAPIILGQIRSLSKNVNKKRIINYVLNEPGFTPSEISRNLEISLGSIRYQIKTLKAEDKLILTREGKFTRAFQNSNTFTKNDKIIISHLKGSTRKQILLNILENPEITNQEISEKLNLDKSTTHWHIKKLREDDIIFSEVKGKFTKYFVNPSVEPELLKWLKI